MDMMRRPNMMKYKNYLYFKAMSLLVAMAVAAYASIEHASREHYGGTWLGYVLGVISTLVVLLLMCYGIHKRSTPRAPEQRVNLKRARRNYEDVLSEFASRRKADRRRVHAKKTWRYGGTLQGWLSAHVYLGASLIVLATLHAGFQFGWNIHTLAYVLMLLVIASGCYGTFAYLNYPHLITQNMGKDTLNELLLKIAELDELARIRALGLPDEVNAIALKARQETRLGGNLFQQLSGYQRGCPTELAVNQIRLLGEKFINEDQPKLLRDLYSVLLHKQKLVSRARNEIMLKGRMQFWLYLHAPLSIALLAALFAHIVAILFYW